MIFLKKKPEDPRGQWDHIARPIADRIIKWQILLATILNTRANRYSKNQQKRFFWLCCGIAGGGLLLSLWLSSAKMSTSIPAQNYQPAHIGLPSDPPALGKSKPTDSLTNKK